MWCWWLSGCRVHKECGVGGRVAVYVHKECGVGGRVAVGYIRNVVLVVEWRGMVHIWGDIKIGWQQLQLFTNSCW